MTQYRHLYWDSGNKDLRMFSDEGGSAGTTLEVLSYFLRKRYAALLDSGIDYPGEVKTSGTSPFVTIGTAQNWYRDPGSTTEPDDNHNSQGAEPDTNFGSDQTSTQSSTAITYYQNMNHTTAAPTQLAINTTGLLYWTSPDLKMGPIVEADLMDTITTHCLTQMRTGDEVGSYRVAASNPGGGTWSNKGTFFTDTWYGGSENYMLWLKTANTTEPSTPDNYIRWDSTNNEIQLESSTDYSASSKIINDVYLNVIARRHLVYNVATSIVGTNKGTFLDRKYDSTTNVLSLTSSVYTRSYSPSGTLATNQTFYFTTNGNRTP